MKTITEWRDLQVGDIVRYQKRSFPSSIPSGEYEIVEMDYSCGYKPFKLSCGYWPLITEESWQFVSRPSKGTFIATCREAVQIGPDDYRMESVSKVFDVGQPMSDVIEWAESQGIKGASVNSVIFSEVS